MSLPRLLTRSRMRVRISPWFPVLLCAFYRLDPVGCFWPFLGAAAIHEAGHCLAVLLCGGSIHSLALTARCAVLQTSPLSYRQEALCALAGPCAGFLLLFWVRLVPWLAFWGLMQGLYNLLPVYPMDGGRALRCALLSRWTPEQADSVSRWVSLGVGGIMAALAVYAACGLHLGLWAALAAGLFLWRMLNCIQREPR